MSDSKSILPTIIMVGGALISCGLGCLAFSRLRALNTREHIVHSETLAENLHKKDTEQTFNVTATTPSQQGYFKQRDMANYNWSQTSEEVIIQFSVDPHVKAKHVHCTFNTNTMTIMVDGSVYMKGVLNQAVTPDECSWDLEGTGSKRVLTVTLTKSQFKRSYWDSLIIPDYENDDENLYTN